LPEHGGKPCDENLMETKGCHRRVCPSTDATLTDWSSWTACGVTCGSGTSARKRQVERIRGPGGKGLTTMLAEVRVCSVPLVCQDADCLMSDWSPWGACDQTCGPGVQERIRTIVQKTEHDGHQCRPGPLTEAKGCNRGSCKQCLDGEWADWQEWTACSATCGGGTTFRTRDIKTHPDLCGMPAQGKDRETGFCNLHNCDADKNCEMSPWSEWTQCSARCDGHQTTHRTIIRNGVGEGKECVGITSHSRPCNPAQNQQRPPQCLPKKRLDCKAGEWEAWSTCSTTCGPGQKERRRTVEQMAQNGGARCEEGLIQMKECGRDTLCEAPKPVNCQLGEWEEWGPCSLQTQERMRWKRVAVHAKNNGTCKIGDVKEVGPCKIEPTTRQICEWREWSSWGACTVTCGHGGVMTRQRSLVLQTKPVVEFRRLHEDRQDEAVLAALRHRSQELQTTNLTWESFFAFCAGAIGLLVLATSSRLIARIWQQNGDEEQQE